MIEVSEEKLKWLERTPLAAGKHLSLEEGVCVMEAVAYLAGEKHTDAPECVSLSIAHFLRGWNDGLKPGERDTLLKPLIPEIFGTKCSLEKERELALIALDWSIRVGAVQLLLLSGETAEAGEALAIRLAQAGPANVCQDEFVEAVVLGSDAVLEEEALRWEEKWNKHLAPKRAGVRPAANALNALPWETPLWPPSKDSPKNSTKSSINWPLAYSRRPLPLVDKACSLADPEQLEQAVVSLHESALGLVRRMVEKARKSVEA